MAFFKKYWSISAKKIPWFTSYIYCLNYLCFFLYLLFFFVVVFFLYFEWLSCSLSNSAPCWCRNTSFCCLVFCHILSVVSMAMLVICLVFSVVSTLVSATRLFLTVPLWAFFLSLWPLKSLSSSSCTESDMWLKR